MNASSIDIKEILEATGESSGFDDLIFEGIGLNVFVGREMPQPKNCITIFDTPGFPPDLNLETQGYEYPSVQIRVRNATYINGWDIAERIKNALHGISHTTVNATLYTVIYCANGPALLDWDDNGNARFVINFNMQRRVV